MSDAVYVAITIGLGWAAGEAVVQFVHWLHHRFWEKRK